MNKKISAYLKGDRKYFAIVFFILALIFLVGLITPILIDKEKTNWEKKLSDKIIEIENGAQILLAEKEIQLIEIKKE